MAGDKRDEIRKDLELIKHLLDENEMPPVPTLDDEDIPTLDDAVETDSGVIPESTFKSLLSDAWQESVKELFNDRAIDLPEDIDALSDALKLRIDEAVREWLEETLSANITALRQKIVHELSEELLNHLRAMKDSQLLKQRSSAKPREPS